MRILAIDPGLASLGVVVVLFTPGEPPLAVNVSEILTSNKHTLAQRLLHISQSIDLFFDKYKPDIVCIEEFIGGSRLANGFNTAKSVGVIMSRASKYGCPVFLYDAMTVKQCCTGRRAKVEKEEIISHVTEAYSLGPEVLPRKKDNHKADALAVALCYMRGMRDLGAPKPPKPPKPPKKPRAPRQPKKTKKVITK